MSPADVDAEDPAVLCDVLANGAQFRIENQKDVKFLDLQPLLDELDPLARFKLFGEFFQGELTRLKNDPEISRKIEIERERRKREEERCAQERAEKIARLAAIAAQPNPAAALASLPAETLDLPLMPLRDIIMFPCMETSFIVGREASIKAVQQASGADSLIFLVAQRNEQIDLPAPSDLYQSGVVARIFESRRLPDANLKVTVRGLRTATVFELSNIEGWFRAKVSASSDVEYSTELTSALASVFELLGASSLSVEDRQKLLERWDHNDPRRWIAKCLLTMEKADKNF